LTRLSDFVTEIRESICSQRLMAECYKGREGYGTFSAMSKKRYFPPALRDLTPEEAKKVIADGKNCSEEEAAKFLESLQRQKRQNDQKRNAPLNNGREQEKKRSA
jgi:hypothetical protein